MGLVLARITTTATYNAGPRRTARRDMSGICCAGVVPVLRLETEIRRSIIYFFKNQYQIMDSPPLHDAYADRYDAAPLTM